MLEPPPPTQPLIRPAKASVMRNLPGRIGRAVKRPTIGLVFMGVVLGLGEEDFGDWDWHQAVWCGAAAQSATVEKARIGPNRQSWRRES